MYEYILRPSGVIVKYMRWVIYAHFMKETVNAAIKSQAGNIFVLIYTINCERDQLKTCPVRESDNKQITGKYTYTHDNRLVRLSAIAFITSVDPFSLFIYEAGSISREN